MDMKECFVIYTLKIDENTTQVKQTTLVLDIDDSMYVVGQGCCIPVANGKEAFEIMKLFKENK
jgi:hypothetical protein